MNEPADPKDAKKGVVDPPPATNAGPGQLVPVKVEKQVEAPKPEPEALDLTKETSAETEGAVPAPSTVPYNLDQDREKVRGYIAYSLIAILFLVILGSYLGLLGRWVTMGDLKELLTIIFGPLIALVAAATGFYFGGRK